MSDNAFLTALQKITAGELSLGELLDQTNQLSLAGDMRAAQQLYKVWINFNREHPQLYVAYFNVSGLDSQLGDVKASTEALRSAIAVNPDFMPAYINLGGALERSGDIHGAIEQWRAAVSRPTLINGAAAGYAVTALKQIARLASEHASQDVAETAVRQCLELNPNQRDIVEQFVALRLAQCKWPVIEPWEGVERKALVSSIHPLSLSVYTDDPLLQLAAAERYVRLAVDEKAGERTFDRRNAPIDLQGRRLKVGYVSSDLRDHAIGYLMAEFFELHDRSKVEVFAYYCGIENDGALKRRIQAAVEHWTDIRGMSDDQAAAAIADDGIDILVDVNGHTRDSRTAVFARRPAPIQVNWLGYPGSMGTPYHQYIVADDWIIPPGSELYYSEQVVRLPCYQPNDRKRVIADQRPSRQDAGLPEGAFVFCCFNGTHKINRFTFERWMQILNGAPNSVLWLLDCSPQTQERLRSMAEQRGVAGSRLIFAPKQANPNHLARYPLADLFLDTVPYGAHTTASDALWMAVPVLTLSGRCFASRVCGSLARSAGLEDLVCSSPQEYVEKAIALAANPLQIKSLKARLEIGRLNCTLFDTDKLVRSLEELYLKMCEDHRRGRLPRPDLANLAAYFETGIEMDHEAAELLAVPDYHGLYKAALARRHQMRPMAPDERLWTAADIAAVEGVAAVEAEAEVDAPPARRRARRAVG
jgi:predicted O-linked N-acetylglucosamine transferase (SPINDLY family)